MSNGNIIFGGMQRPAPTDAVIAHGVHRSRPKITQNPKFPLTYELPPATDRLFNSRKHAPRREIFSAAKFPDSRKVPAGRRSPRCEIKALKIIFNNNFRCCCLWLATLKAWRPFVPICLKAICLPKLEYKADVFELIFPSLYHIAELIR